ncbi:hypothetical protein AAVH_29031 [Aphelenchoides avenae]|nr:hypothetical protein AAVH_29031 [Aphelenchus avenae]
MAMERQEQRKKARLFSFEPPKYNAGCRKFIAHFYEIIQEERLCRPYFDLEFAKDLIMSWIRAKRYVTSLRPRRTPTTKPPSSTLVLRALDDSFTDLRISHETLDALSIRSQTPP